MKDGVLPDLSSVSNVCIFMADAVRWDYLPNQVRSLGLSIQTIASSLTTHTSLPTMLTGLHPHRHGVVSWQHRLGDISSVLNFPGYDNAFFHPGPESVLQDGTFAILQEDTRRPIDDLTAPWMYVERHHGGHAPFNSIEQWDGEWNEFVDEFAGDVDKLTDYYARATRATAEDFLDRIQTIEERGELDETLIVFCSDHGEYLGESGFVDHSSPIRPEGVYVPMVFIHPDIKGGTTVDGIARHIDLFPTLLSALEEDIPSHVDGVNLQSTQPEQGYCHARAYASFRDKQIRTYEADSIWDKNGGYVWNNTSGLKRLALAVGLVIGNSWKSQHLRDNIANYPSAAGHFLKNNHTFGNPSFSIGTGEELLTDVLEKKPLNATDQSNLDKPTKEQLQNLGYL